MKIKNQSARFKENWQGSLMEIGDTVGDRGLHRQSPYIRVIVGWHDQGVVVQDPDTFDCMIYTVREINQGEVGMNSADWYIA